MSPRKFQFRVYCICSGGASGNCRSFEILPKSNANSSSDRDVLPRSFSKEIAAQSTKSHLDGVKIFGKSKTFQSRVNGRMSGATYHSRGMHLQVSFRKYFHACQRCFKAPRGPSSTRNISGILNNPVLSEDSSDSERLFPARMSGRRKYWE